MREKTGFVLKRERKVLKRFFGAKKDNGWRQSKMLTDKKAVRITYTNYRGETGERTIIPLELIFSKNEWHPQEQWMIRAIDVDKGAERTFTLKDIDGWKQL